MSENFLRGLEIQDNFTETENGAVALKSTKSDLVDLFGSIGSLRNESEKRILTKFSKAFAENELLAMKILFYNRDIRGGLGERKTSRVIYNFLANNYPKILKENLDNLVEFGRWDDLVELIKHKELESFVTMMIKNQLAVDYNTDNPSLLAKWLPSINTSSNDTVKLAKEICKIFNWKEKEYRKMLSKVRKKINVVEQKMASKQWTEIEYSKVPSRAMNIYRNAFKRNDEDRFEQYIDSLQKGETKINAGTLYPYDIIEKISCIGYGSYNIDQILEEQCKALPDYIEGENNILIMADTSGSMNGRPLGLATYFAERNRILEEQWKALPNYIEGENNILIMADTSGSMNGRPLDTSLGLAIYFAERNKGYYHNKFMTFSSEPQFVELKGKTLHERVMNIDQINSNTNLEKAFNLILNTAVQSKISQDELPKSLIIISDMQFDSCESYYESYYENTSTIWFDKMKNNFNSKGYEIPNIVFWNVDDRKDSFQATCEHKGVQLVSGQSTATFKSLLQNMGKTPYDAMINTLSNERYDCVKV